MKKPLLFVENNNKNLEATEKPKEDIVLISYTHKI
jgi:hypothetical protein